MICFALFIRLMYTRGKVHLFMVGYFYQNTLEALGKIIDFN